MCICVIIFIKKRKLFFWAFGYRIRHYNNNELINLKINKSDTYLKTNFIILILRPKMFKHKIVAYKLRYLNVYIIHWFLFQTF